MNSFIKTSFLACGALLLAHSNANADMVAPNPECYVKGVIVDAREEVKTKMNNPDDFKTVKYHVAVVDVKIEEIKFADKNSNFDNGMCKITTSGYGLYKPVTTLEIDQKDKSLSELKGKTISGTTHENGDEYGNYFGFGDYKLGK